MLSPLSGNPLGCSRLLLLYFYFDIELCRELSLPSFGMLPPSSRRLSDALAPLPEIPATEDKEFEREEPEPDADEPLPEEDSSLPISS